MRALVVGDEEAVNQQIQRALLLAGHDCPASGRAPLESAEDRLAQMSPQLVVVALSPDSLRALTALGRLRPLTHAKILAVGPGGDTRLVLEAIRQGAADYIDENSLDAELAAALRRFRVELTTTGESGKVIAVLAPNGGTGSTTLAANLATILAQEHKKTLLLDLHLENGDLAALLDVKPLYTLADLCRNLPAMDRVMFERSLVSHSSGAHLLSSPLRIADVKEVTAEGVGQIVSLGASLFPYVVLDLDHSFRDVQLKALHVADLLLLVMRLDFASLRNVRRALDYLQDLGIGQERIRLVVNRYGQPKEVPAAKAEEALGQKIQFYLPEDLKAINRANNNGVPVVLEAPTARFCRSLRQLAASINGKGKAH